MNEKSTATSGEVGAFLSRAGGWGVAIAAVVASWQGAIEQQAETRAEVRDLKSQVAEMVRKQDDLDMWIKRFILDAHATIASGKKIPQ